MTSQNQQCHMLQRELASPGKILSLLTIFLNRSFGGEGFVKMRDDAEFFFYPCLPYLTKKAIRPFTNLMPLG